ncbi:carbamoyltransferase C-terminal domain-containing protein [Streptomyces sp. NPDC004393]|uniref:carbamoyltransferase C-terminal domain-containing protein n=1 Tax=Streptomyces sp. NPDC004533 TaxID=3154278 RepID=UPI0033AB45CD
MSSDYFGRDYTSEEIEQALRRDPRSGLVERRRTPFTWRRESDIVRTAAQMIADGKIIGWFQGGSELGPRALGARSILADYASTWFDLDVTSPFMLLAPPVRPDHANKIAGVVHVDGTARVQTVDPAAAPAYGALIEDLHQLTGVPVVLNTSFNDRDPIVETPAHALATLQACDLDVACVGEYLVESPDLPSATALEGMTTSHPPLREAARAIVLDADDRVLLLRYDENGGFWATPGGSLEDGEDHATATLRELSEELGIDEKAVELAAQLAERSKDRLVGGREVRQVEKYFLTRVSAADVEPARASQPDNIREHSWWTVAELRATAKTVYPLGLADLLSDVLAHGAPMRPVIG